jgi:hypothetical protein
MLENLAQLEDDSSHRIWINSQESKLATTMRI